MKKLIPKRGTATTVVPGLIVDTAVLTDIGKALISAIAKVDITTATAFATEQRAYDCLIRRLKSHGASFLLVADHNRKRIRTRKTKSKKEVYL